MMFGAVCRQSFQRGIPAAGQRGGGLYRKQEQPAARRNDGENAGIGTQSTDDASTLPDTAQDRPVTDAPMMVMVDNTLYQSEGEVSTVEGRCGNMDGEITSQTAGGTDAPTENDQSNFGTGYGYQRMGDTLEVLIDSQWIGFRPITGSDV